MRKILLIFIIITISILSVQAQVKRASLDGIIYFTNNTPSNLDTFPVELYTSDQKRRVALTKLDKNGVFTFNRLKKAVYTLKISANPADRCVLLYRVDFTRKLKISTSIIMDAECAAGSAAVRKLPE